MKTSKNSIYKIDYTFSSKVNSDKDYFYVTHMEENIKTKEEWINILNVYL